MQEHFFYVDPKAGYAPSPRYEKINGTKNFPQTLSGADLQRYQKNFCFFSKKIICKALSFFRDYARKKWSLRGSRKFSSSLLQHVVG